MFPIHDQVAASITVTGVALGCINPEDNRWEVAFIRYPNHRLTMEVEEDTSAGTKTIYPKAEIPLGSSITIETTNSNPPAPTLFTGEEDRRENFDLILDIEEDVYKQQIDLKRPDSEVTPLFVPGATLYSVRDSLSEFPLRLIEKGDAEKRAVKTLGQICTTAGADITCGEDRGEVVIKVGGNSGFKLRLPSSPGTRYTIAFDNTCPPDSPAAEPPAHGVIKPSDFVLYYAILDPKELGEFDLTSDDDDSGPGVVCNYSHLGITGRIFPLPK